MKFKTATKTANALVACSVALCVIGLFFNNQYASIRLLLTAGALLLLSAGLIVTLVFCKCPHCGKRIFFGASRAVYCPKCRRNLETGKKVSKKRVEKSFRN